MKAIILVSSFFYLLGLKLGYKTDLIGKMLTPVIFRSHEKEQSEKQERNYFWKSESKKSGRTENDSIDNKTYLKKTVPPIPGKKSEDS